MSDKKGLGHFFNKRFLACNADELITTIYRRMPEVALARIPYCKNINDADNPLLQASILTQQPMIFWALLDNGASTETESQVYYNDDMVMKPLDVAISGVFFGSSDALLENGAKPDIKTFFEKYDIFTKLMLMAVGFDGKPLANGKEPFVAMLDFVDDPSVPGHTDIRPKYFRDEGFQHTVREVQSSIILKNSVIAFVNRGIDLNKRDEVLGVTPLEIVAHSKEASSFIGDIISILTSNEAKVTDQVMAIAKERGGDFVQRELMRAKVEQERQITRKQQLKI